MKSRRISRLLVVATAVAAVVFLVGCTRAVKTPISFAAGDLTLTLPAMVKGTAISAVVLPEASGGEGALTHTLAPEVPGLTFDPETRQLSGTPTTAGSYPLRYTATDEDGATATLSFTLTVRPTLWGSWRNTSIRYYDGEVGTVVETLTFTTSRFIMYRSYYRPDGSFDGWHWESGTWAASDDTVTKTWYVDDDDDHETPEVLRSLDKDYVWVDEARDVLLLHEWRRWSASETFDRYERVKSVSPSSVVGVWQNSDLYDDWDFTLTVNADGTLLFDASELGGVWKVTAKWQLDEDEYFLNLTDATDVWTPTGGVPQLRNLASRFAFAPTDQWPDGMTVSFWHEDPDHPNFKEFGSYWMTFQRQ